MSVCHLFFTVEDELHKALVAGSRYTTVLPRSVVLCLLMLAATAVNKVGSINDTTPKAPSKRAKNQLVLIPLLEGIKND